MNIVFMGSSDFGIPTLERLVKSSNTIVAIVSTPPRPKGRGLQTAPSAVAAYAQSHSLQPLFTPQDLKTPEFLNNLAEIKADLFIVIAFRILPPAVFSLPRFGTINVHASLLPRYRGPAPIQRAIEHGEKRTGVTIFKIDDGVDTGGILLQKAIDIEDDETTPVLCNRLGALGADAIIESLALLESGEVAWQRQNDTGVSTAPKLTKNEGLINWNLPAQALYNKIRAFKPFPGVYTFLGGRRLGIEWAKPVPGASRGSIGCICDIDRDGFSVQCGEGQLTMLSVKPEGKKVMPAADFLRGAHLSKGFAL